MGLSAESPVPEPVRQAKWRWRKKKRNDHEARRKLFPYLLRHLEWNWDYRFLIVRTPRWYETR
jgi:hypothetical protein